MQRDCFVELMNWMSEQNKGYLNRVSDRLYETQTSLFISWLRKVHTYEWDLCWWRVRQRIDRCVMRVILITITILVPRRRFQRDDVASRQHLRSASRRLLVVPRHRLSTYGRRAFAVAGPTAWHSFRIISGIRILLQTSSSACWKRFCSQRYQCN